MSNYKITSNSIYALNTISPDGLTYASINGSHSVTLSVAGSNSVLLEDGGFILTSNAWGLYLQGATVGAPSSWTVTINGQIHSTGGYGIVDYGTSKITIGENGSVLANYAILSAYNSAMNLINNGYVDGRANAAVELSAETLANESLTNQITNNGIMYGAIRYSTAGNGAATTNTSITNSITANIYNTVIDLSLAIGTNSLKNAGYIGWDSATLMSYKGGAGDDTITNAKGATIDGDVDLGDSLKINTVTNAGTLGYNPGSDSITGGTHADKVTNSGKVLGGISLGDGINTFINSGEVGKDGGNWSYYATSGTNTITNNVGGHLLGGVYYGNSDQGTEVLTNYGAIDGTVSAGTGNDKIYNKAHATMGAISLYGGSDYLENDGTVASIDARLNGAGGTTIKNSGVIYSILFSNNGNHLLESGSGHVGGNIDLGTGNDVFVGGSSGETVQDNVGLDSYKFGSGNDFFIAVYSSTDLHDTADGGAGIDAVDASNDSTHYIDVNLSKTAYVAPTGSTSGFFGDHVAAQTATFAQESATADTILNFENIYGSNYSGSGDVLVGSDAANKIYGLAGNDNLLGNGGNDLLDAGSGNDVLVGGLGADNLYGRSGNDSFVYFSTKESGTTVSTRDTIGDFTHGTDHIDLHAIDADTKTTGNQDFHFIGTDVVWNHAAGDLRVVDTPTGQVIEGDVDGNGVADFSIFINDSAHTAFAGTDFYL